MASALLFIKQKLQKALQGGAMKTFFDLLENLWVAVAFAEAGEYESLREEHAAMRYEPDVRIHAI